MGMLVAVTGGAGFIGRATVKLLLERGHEVLVVDDFSSSSPEALKDVEHHLRAPGRGLRVVRVDVSRRGSLKRAISHAGWGSLDAVVHLAAVASVDRCRLDPYRCYQVNVLGSLSVAEDSIDLGADRLVYASSAAVYGEPESLPISEDHPARPISLYGYTKLHGEHVLLAVARERGVRVSLLRYFNVYGPGMNPEYAGVVSRFIEAISMGASPVIYGDGLQTRDFVHVEDVAEANVLAAERGAEGVYNIGTGVETSIIELCRLIARLYGRKCDPVYAEARRGDIRRSVADASRAREFLGWIPRIGLEEGLSRLIQSLKPS